MFVDIDFWSFWLRSGGRVVACITSVPVQLATDIADLIPCSSVAKRDDVSQFDLSAADGVTDTSPAHTSTISNVCLRRATHQDRPTWQTEVTEIVRLGTLTELSSLRLVTNRRDVPRTRACVCEMQEHWTLNLSSNVASMVDRLTLNNDVVAYWKLIIFTIKC